MNRYRDEYEDTEFEYDKDLIRDDVAKPEALGLPLNTTTDENDVQQSSILRILIVTDSHLGFKETDIYRQNESFDMFKEAMSYAKLFDADCIFHAGDLFDIAKPTRSTMKKAIDIIRDVTVGSKSTDITVEGGIFKDGRPCNIYDDSINIQIPIFLIHGNHDDPIEKDQLAAADILHSARIINYFGVIPELDNIKVNPVTITKGESMVVLYGLGNVKDNRLHRAFENGLVKFHQIETKDCGNDPFSVLLIHQNRFRGAKAGMAAKNCIHEYQLPSFLDLVVWGHEHDCEIEATPCANHSFHIIQPGSSVITSYQPSEAARPKHIAIVEVHKKQFRVLPIPLSNNGSVFAFMDVKLHDMISQEEEYIEDVAAHIETFLHEKMEELIVWAVEEMAIREKNRMDSIQNIATILGYGGEVIARLPKITTQGLPLIRIRVDHSNPIGEKYPTISINRFGDRYTGRVANPYSLLLFTAKANRRSQNDGGGGLGLAEITVAMDNSKLLGEDVHKVLDGMIMASLKKPLTVLLEPSLNFALHQYVQKDDTGSLPTSIDEMLHGAREESLMHFSSIEGDYDDGDILDFMKNKSAIYRADQLKQVAECGIEESAMIEAWPGAQKLTTHSVYGTQSHQQKRVKSDLPLEDEYIVPKSRTKAKAKTKRKAKAKKTVKLLDDDDTSVEHTPVKRVSPRRKLAKKKTPIEDDEELW